MTEQELLNIAQIEDVTVVSFNAVSITGGSGMDSIGGSLRSFLVENKPSKIVIDFDGVKFFSSIMLGVLVDVWKRQKEYGGRMLISGIDPQLSRVFKVTNLDKIFEFSSDRAHALGRIKHPLR